VLPPLPSSNRTCGVTASGLPEIVQPQGMHNSRSFRRQQPQTLALQVGVPCLVRRRTITTLTTTTQVMHQSLLNVAVHDMVRCGRITVTEVLIPAAQIASNFANQCGSGLPTPSRSGQFTHPVTQPSQVHALDRLRTVGLGAEFFLKSRQERLRIGDASQRHTVHARRSVVLQHQPPCRQQHVEPVLDWRNEAESGSLALRLTPLRRQASTPRSPPAAAASATR